MILRNKKIALVLLSGLALFSFTSVVQTERFDIIPEKSSVKWIGKKLSGEHVGVVDIKSGFIEMDSAVILSGEFVLDMTSIKATDSESKKLHNHLHSEDFFGTTKYPESKLVITGSKPLSDNKLEVTGNLTIKGITKPITFTAKNTGKTASFRIFNADISIDRTIYGITYKSSVFGDAMIMDTFKLKIKITGKKKT